jgi:ribosomal protein L25 (general stress protein Ctc)
MSIEFTAFPRATEGRGASRRMRRAGKAPGIVYGGAAAPTPIELDHNALFHALRNETFHSSVLTMKLDGARSGCSCATCRCIRTARRCCTSTSSASTRTRRST